MKSCSHPGDEVTDDGCLAWSINNETECTEVGGTWRQPSTSQETCLSSLACLETGVSSDSDGESLVFSGKNKTECNSCGLLSDSVNEWSQGALIDRSQLEWRSREWRSDVFQWRDQIFNENQFSADLEAARSEYLFLTFSTALDCLSSKDQTTLSQIACDCQPSPSADCFGDALVLPLLSSRVCSLFARNITVSDLSVIIDEEAEFDSGCIGLTVEVSDSSAFARSTKSVVSSALVQSLELKSLSVVKNNNGVVVGQLASDGYRVVLGDEGDEQKVTGSFQICVPSLSLSRQSGWKRMGVARSSLGRKISDSSFRLLSDLSVTETSNSLHCFPVDRSGMYALVWHLPGASDAAFFDTLAVEQQAAIIIAIIAYVSVWVLVSLASFNMMLWWIAQPIKHKFSIDTFKTSLNFVLLWLSTFVRWVYFILVLSGVAGDIPVFIEIMLVELPLFFFFSVLSLIVLKWLDVARKSTSGRSKKSPPVWSITNVLGLLLNIIMYSLLLVFAILSAVGVGERDQSKCSTETKQQDPTMSIVYHVLISLICFIIGISFIIIGSKVTIQLLRLGGATTQRVRFVQFTVIAASCSIAMILQAILVLIASIIVIPSIAAVLILILIELVPILLLIWTWNKPISAVKAIRSVASLASGTSSTQSESTTGSGSASGTASTSNDASSTTTSGTSSDSGIGLGRLWSLGTDSLSGSSVGVEDEE